jgi:hypothetical protein
MVVSLKDFLATGVFGQVPFGCDQRHLEAVAGQPEATGGVSRKHRQPIIWRYGDVEFYFSRSSGGLEMIHIDRFSGADSSPQGWGELQVDPWVIREGIGKAEFLRALEFASLVYTVRDGPALNQEAVVVASGVEAGFVSGPDEFSDFVGLAYLSHRVSAAELGSVLSTGVL